MKERALRVKNAGLKSFELTVLINEKGAVALTIKKSCDSFFIYPLSFLRLF